jgi:hypothetical protein
MSFLEIYILVAIALGTTSYFMLYKPAIELVEEILETKTVYSSGILKITWLLAATIITPLTAWFLLKNNNQDFIEGFAVALANKIIEEDGEE